MSMAFSEMLWMTKTKIFILIIILILCAPFYYGYGCINGVCAIAEACNCGFQPANFFTVFIISFILAGFIGEVVQMFTKKK